MNKFNPDYRVAPGETILEALEDRGMTIEELASKLMLTEEETNFLLKGEKVLSPDIANVLEELFEVPVSFWLNLEMFYQKKKNELFLRKSSSTNKERGVEYEFNPTDRKVKRKKDCIH